MYFKRIIPSLLLSNRRLVKGIKFKEHQDTGSPASTVRIFNDQLADEVMVCDIEATQKKRLPDLDSLNVLARRCFVPISFGGGVSSLDIAIQVILNGADKVILNSHALENPALISELARALGEQAVVVAIDVIQTSSGYKVVHGNATALTDYEPLDWCKTALSLGAGELLLTSVDREGTRSGLDIGLIETIAGVIDLPIIVQGGIGTLDDCCQGLSIDGVSGIAMGRMLQYSDANLIKIRRHMLQQGLHLRRC